MGRAATIPWPARPSAEARAILLEVLTAHGERRAAEIGNLHAAGIAPATVEILIDCEEDPYLRAVLVGLLREVERA